MDHSKETTRKQLKNTLTEYYSSLSDGEKQVFRFNVMMKLGVTQSSLYRWLRGETKPRKTEAIILAEICGIPAPQLYPHHFLLDNIKNQ